MGVRYHHISNADLGERNTGINGVLPYVGLSFLDCSDAGKLYE